MTGNPFGNISSVLPRAVQILSTLKNSTITIRLIRLKFLAAAFSSGISTVWDDFVLIVMIFCADFAGLAPL